MNLKLSTTLVFFVLTCAHLPAQSQTTVDETTTSDSEYVNALAIHRDQANRMVVQVMVNDQGPFNFLLDTGANQSAVTAAFAERLQLEPAAPAVLQGVTGQAVVPRVKVATLQAGSLLLKNQKLAVVTATMKGLEDRKSVV